ncbi:MAG: hypothetical protein SFX73_33200 [Kofleriaceae bacterium]|nr:hypothetical protein [Kofleriaceae bacterium]
MRKLFFLTRVVLGLGVGFGLGACGGGDAFDEVLGKMEGFKKQMCECKDKACTEKVQDEWRAYRKTMKEKIGKNKPNDAQEKKGNALDEEMRKCRKQFDAAETPTPTTPEPSGTPPAGSAAPTGSAEPTAAPSLTK